MHSPEELAELRSVALQIAREAGRIIVDDRPSDLRVATKSTTTDVVTEMDQRAQDHIVAALRQHRPHDGFLGEEEGESHLGQTGITWVVDPIDGTVNYLYGIAAYSVSIAAVTGDPRVEGAWQPVAGAVVDPVSGTAFSAVLGGGATREDAGGRVTPLAVTDRSDLAQSLVATGFGYAPGRRAWQAAVLADLIADIRDIRRIGSAALDLCRVAEGSVDAYYERGLNPWDLAAGWLIVTEAGGVVSGVSRAYPSSDLVVAAGNALHESFVMRLRQGIARVTHIVDVTSG